MAGRAAGRGIAYVQLARGHFDTIMRQSQASMVSLIYDKPVYLNPSTHFARQLQLYIYAYIYRNQFSAAMLFF
jgi:hemolysin activation/secretion protein